MKKTFPCGHKGRGQYCHRCANGEKELAAKEAARLAVRQEKIERRQSVDVDLTGIPDEVVKKVVEVVRSLESGVPYNSFKGKRLYQDRDTISIPIGRSFRLICKDADGATLPCKVMSHEEYNVWIKLFRQGRTTT